jgi:hypothetical protein
VSLLERIRQALGGRDEPPDTPGEGTGRQGPWVHPGAGPGSKELHSLDVEGDPRGGEQAPEYRRADPRELVVTEDVAMMGPGGAPVGELEADEAAPPRETETRSAD